MAYRITAFVEQVGYDPTPSDFQSDAMTTSATAPFAPFGAVFVFCWLRASRRWLRSVGVILPEKRSQVIRRNTVWCDSDS